MNTVILQAVPNIILDRDNADLVLVGSDDIVEVFYTFESGVGCLRVKLLQNNKVSVALFRDVTAAILNAALLMMGEQKLCVARDITPSHDWFTIAQQADEALLTHFNADSASLWGYEEIRKR